tara:strand:- start:921 stop:1862 length:942 start_codon:yes stop_codon:yes gene_type:complete
MVSKKNASSGHKLGQIIGDWFEEYFAYSLLKSVADELDLFIDSRFVERNCRGKKIYWSDKDENTVDYDFVLELGGDKDKKGIPIGFFETFWRRGSRHSKDKARDDSGKLVPMRDTFPTARFLGIISAGDFTEPAIDLVKSKSIDLFPIPKKQIIKSWERHNLSIDYADDLPEEEKSILVNNISNKLQESKELYESISNELISLIGVEVLINYKNRVKNSISAPPLSFEITPIYTGEKQEFLEYETILEYLKSLENSISPKLEEMEKKVIYKIIYGDGSIFIRENISINSAQELHKSVGIVQKHFKEILSQTNY